MRGEEDDLSRLEKYGNATETANHSRSASRGAMTTSWMSSDTHLARSSSDSPPTHENKAEENHDQEHETVGEEPKGDLVDWDGPDDPDNPKNWSYKRKWFVTTLVSLISFVTAASSSVVAPALPQIATDLNISSTVVQSLVFAVFGLGFVVGALPYGPLSELYGRAPVLHLSFFVFFVFNLASGFAQTKTQLILFRFISGIGGSSPNTIGAGVVSDCFNAEDIGRGSAFYGLAPRLGPALGPIIGGFIVQNLNYRWSFYITSMLAGLLFIFGLFFIQETRPSVIMKKKAIKLRKKTGNQELHTKEWPLPDGESDFQHLLTGLKRPLIFLATHHIIQYLAMYQFFVAGTLYLILSTYHRLWVENYHESIQIGGLNYISLGLGLVVGNQFCARVSDKLYEYLRKRFDSGDPSDPDAGRPEYRVPLMLLGAVCLPAGFILYGWSADKHVFWLVPNIGIFFVAMGIIIISQGIKLYNVSTYGTFAASATGAVNLTRAVGSGCFPLFAPFMLQTLGYGWTGTLLAGIAILFGIPGPILLWYYGPRLRKKADGLQKKRGDGGATN